MATHCCFSLPSLPPPHRRNIPCSPVLPYPLRPIKPFRKTLRVSSFTGKPIISPDDQWGMWTALFSAGAFGIWSEQNTAAGKALSGALVSTLVGLAASSLGIIASQAQAYNVVLEYLLPLSIPLLLFNADLRLILRSTGTLLIAFLLGSGFFPLGFDAPLFLLNFVILMKFYTFCVALRRISSSFFNYLVASLL